MKPIPSAPGYFADGDGRIYSDRWPGHGDGASPTCYERAQALGVPEVDVLVTMPAMRRRLDALLERASVSTENPEGDAK